MNFKIPPNPTGCFLKTSPVTVTFNAVQGPGISFADPKILSYSSIVGLALKDCHFLENLLGKE